LREYGWICFGSLIEIDKADIEIHETRKMHTRRANITTNHHRYKHETATGGKANLSNLNANWLRGECRKNSGFGYRDRSCREEGGVSGKCSSSLGREKTKKNLRENRVQKTYSLAEGDFPRDRRAVHGNGQHSKKNG